MRTLKEFQKRAVESGIEVFSYAKSLLDAAGEDEAGRVTAIHSHGYLLLEAPTGSGKTLIAGNIAERFSHEEAVVWFWFAPFKGVVDQTAAFLREEFAGLRLRVLAEDRNPTGSRGGDIFVTTWGAVATRVADQRNVRRSGELAASLDDFIASLRAQGFRIGVVVDEAHHGFHGKTQAADFFRSVLKPEYTILITATPDDRDLEDLQKKMHLGEVHRISISRHDAVESGLVKTGVSCITWEALENEKKALVDFETTALLEGAKTHREIKQTLADAGISLVPLMLVQADSDEKDSVERIKKKLLQLGFSEDQIAVHTAAEPDAGLMALANDEKREVLIFKMAVALGFDAPRAWTLVSMRAAKDADFGVQLVGRILRVHRRVQGRKIPEIQRYGHVFLAASETQSGIHQAGERINKIQTAYAHASPNTFVIQIGGKNTIQTLAPGESVPTMFPVPPEGAFYTAVSGDYSLENDAPGTSFSPVVSGPSLFHSVFSDAASPAKALSGEKAAATGKYAYDLKPNVPRRFTTQILAEDFEPTAEDCARYFMVSAANLFEVFKKQVRVQKVTLDVFKGEIQTEFDFARLSPEEIATRAQRILSSEVFDRKVLWKSLLERLTEILNDQGCDMTDGPEEVKNWLDILLVTHPHLFNDARRKALAKGAVFIPALELPGRLSSDSPLPPSAKNVYGRLPPGMNGWEKEFAQWLDKDSSGRLLWWHRNPPNKDYSVRVLLENGRGFFPDFILGVHGRSTVDHALLADTKFAFELRKELPKLLAEHKDYGPALILSLENNRWFLAGKDASGRPMLTEEFRVVNAAGY